MRACDAWVCMVTAPTAAPFLAFRILDSKLVSGCQDLAIKPKLSVNDKFIWRLRSISPAQSRVFLTLPFSPPTLASRTASKPHRRQEPKPRPPTFHSYHLRSSSGSNKIIQKRCIDSPRMLHIILPVSFIIGQWKMKYRGNTNTFIESHTIMNQYQGSKYKDFKNTTNACQPRSVMIPGLKVIDVYIS